MKILQYFCGMEQQENNIYQQIIAGIYQLINGEGGCGRVVGMSVDNDDNAIIVQHIEMSDRFRQSLMDNINEQISEWRVNPFTNIATEEKDKIKFYLLPEEEIEKAYKQQSL